ncbi:hypothetical protein HXX76_003129 [Chlamydomonas incerta]|uniref:Uncharacterized protein n=1 Tax=Chlamydomonas incerta TaxID=51695 RepID=A0A835W5N2_CHLIN|nr:hypothetical protein HXX76_003129 [Chlamydomonas incerta]|eukprot:KAG2441507.1 hypothetical protein HXX76_003129 [Chlamydomonas incerta]
MAPLWTRLCKLLLVTACSAVAARIPGAYGPAPYGSYGGGYGSYGYGPTPPPPGPIYGGGGYGGGGYGGYGGYGYGHYAPAYPPPPAATPPYYASQWPPMEEALERPPASPEPPQLPPAWRSPPQLPPPGVSPPPPPSPSPPALPLTDIVGCYQFLGPDNRRLFPANELSAGHGSAGGGVGPNAGPKSFDAAACVKVVAGSGGHFRYVGFFNGHMCFGIGGILPPSALAAAQPFTACEPCPTSPSASNSTGSSSSGGGNGGKEPQPEQLRCGSDTRMAIYDLTAWPWVRLAPALPPMAPWPPEPEDFGSGWRRLRRRLRQRA